MEIRTLQYFLTVVREENISRAADILHITQPTLSRQMTQLEEELGTRLFIRGRHLTLTDAGVMLRRRAEEVIDLINKIENEIEEQNEVGGVISIGSGALIVSQSLPKIMEDFRKIYPKTQYRFYTNSAEYIKEQLDQGLLNFGILLEPIDITKYEYIRMTEKEKWGLFIQKDHPLAKKEYVTKEDLVSTPLIVTDRISLQKELENWLGDSFSMLNIFGTYNVITNVITFVKYGVAAALTIEGAVNLYGHEDMVFKPLYPELSMTSVLAWKKFQPNFGVAEKFLEYFKSIH